MRSSDRDTMTNSALEPIASSSGKIRFLAQIMVNIYSTCESVNVDESLKDNSDMLHLIRATTLRANFVLSE